MIGFMHGRVGITHDREVYTHDRIGLVRDQRVIAWNNLTINRIIAEKEHVRINN